MFTTSRHRLALAAIVLGALVVPPTAGAARPDIHHRAGRTVPRGHGHRHRGAVPTPPAPAPTGRWDFAGTVQSIDTHAGTLALTVAEAPRDAAAVGSLMHFSVGADTSFVVADVNGDGRHNLADVRVGDRVVASIAPPASPSPAGATLAAVALYDVSSPPAKPPAPAPVSPPAQPPSTTSPPSTSAPSAYWAFDGTVANIDVAAGTMLVTIAQVYSAASSYVGQRLSFEVTASTRMRVADVNGDGTRTLADLSVGDSVDVYVAAPASAPAAGAPLAALEVSDVTHPPTATNPPATTSPPAAT